MITPSRPSQAPMSAFGATTTPPIAMDDARSRVRGALESLAAELSADGLPAVPIRGQLLRPLVAYLAVPASHRPYLDHAFWLGALALQMVHEASLVHDDIIDGADTRRGEPTAVSRLGVGGALAWGDHLLTAAYRVAFMSGLPGFMQAFVEAVERTVAGEILQGRRRGSWLDPSECEEIATGKSGELFGAALALGAAATGSGDLDSARVAGRDLGLLYQRIDDLLDCCPGANAGKPPFQDYDARLCTWVFLAARVDDFSLSHQELHTRLFGGDGQLAAHLLEDLVARSDSLGLRFRRLLPDADSLLDLLERWTTRARVAIEQERAVVPGALADAPRSVRVSAGPQERIRSLVEPIRSPEEWPRYFRHHSRTFSTAARLFPRDVARTIAGVYAYCRFTDDLVDGRLESEDVLRGDLHAWAKLTREAYGGAQTGIALLDDVLGEAREKGVPLEYPEELVRGVAMDIAPRPYRSMGELRLYTHRVASVVGLWLTRSFGVHDAWTLERAAALGHAMQLTNIIRDVGEDLGLGRIYLPTDLMATHGVRPERLHHWLSTGTTPDAGYHDLLRALMEVADGDYDRALEAIPNLPRFAQRPIAVAARVYQGIHEKIRANDFDSVHIRAYTTATDKARLAWAGLRDLRRVRRRQALRTGSSQPVPVEAQPHG